MSKSLFHTVVLFLFSFVALAQTENDSIRRVSAVDSIKANAKTKGITVEEVIIAPEIIDPLAPSKAAFYSAVLPGLGQIYNKKYWKAPIVWGIMGWGIYNYSTEHTKYRRYRNAFKRRKAGFTDDEFYDPDGNGVINVSTEGLENAQENIQQSRDLWLLLNIGIYALNIIDANVTAHLKQFNVSDKLAYDISPYLDLNEVTGDPSYGFTLVVKF